MLVDKNGTAVNLGDWITNTLTGALYEVLEVTDLAALCAKIDEIFDPDQKQQVDIKANEISDHYVVNPADETITDIMGDFLAYDYNTKFYRVAYIAFARRIMRAHLYEVNQTQDEFNKILAQIYAQIKEINDRLDSGELIPHFTIGTVATSDTPQVTITGTVQNPVLNFFLPKGAKGDKGEQGDRGATGAKGADGAAATVVVKSTTTLSPGSQATVVNAGTSNAAQLEFGIPKGDTPVRGVDYWTDADQRQIVSDTVAAIPVASASVNGLISFNTVDGRMSAPVVTLAGTSSAYTGTLSGPPWATTLAGLKGRLLVIVPSVTSASVDVTLNINSLGAKNIRRFTQTGTPVAVPTAGYFRLSVPYLVMYDGTQFVVVGDVQPNGGADFISPVAVSKGGFGGTTVAEAWTTVGVPYAGTAAPKVAATAAVGTATKWAREDHVHPVQTAVSGNAGTATKLATARGLWGQSFDGSAAVSGDMSGVGNILSSATNTKTVGTSANKFLAMYATTFYGALSGNATTATSATSAGKLSASRTFSLTGNAAGSGAGDLSGNISINVTAVTATALASTAKEIYVGAASSAPANAVLIIEP